MTRSAAPPDPEAADPGDEVELVDSATAHPVKDPGKKKALFTALKVLLLVAMVGFAGWALYKNWAEVSDALKQLNLGLVILSLPPVALAMGCAMLVWRSLLADLGAPLPVKVAARIFFVSQLGKYLPGSVWSIATQMELGREHKVPRRVGFATGMLALVLTGAVGLPVAAVTLPFAAPSVLGRYWWGMLFIPVFAVILYPRVLGPLLNFGFRLIRQPALPKAPSVRGMAKAAGWQTLVSVFFGVHAWILLLALHAPAGRALLAAIGGYALAYALGLLAIPVPAGAGVRDIALGVAFASVVTGPQAGAVAIVSRVALTVVDLSLAGGQYALTRRKR